jgi:hypothetical protein
MGGSKNGLGVEMIKECFKMGKNTISQASGILVFYDKTIDAYAL